MRPRSHDVERRIFAAFGGQVRQLRTGAGLTQGGLAELAGMHRSYVGSVERGERNISLEAIHRIAAALGVSTSKLMSAVDNIDTDPDQ